MSSGAAEKDQTEPFGWAGLPPIELGSRGVTSTPDEVRGAEPPPELEPGAALDEKHVLEQEIGRGGMGRVLKVKDVDLNRDVAMKVLLDAGGNPDRFLGEAQITGQLDHPNVLPVHDMGVSAQGELFFTMKLVRGQRTLKDCVRALREGDAEAHAELSMERRVQVVQQLCDVLEFAHQRGVTHRDVKPENVILGQFGEVYLVDWGLAKLGTPQAAPGALPADAAQVASEVQIVGNPDREATREGAIVGTVAYMAPEQVLGRHELVGPWSDLYSLSALLYEFLSLHHYLDGAPQESYVELLSAIVEFVPVAAESWFSQPNGRVPRSLSIACAKGLAKAPTERYASARELRQHLQLWLEGRAPVVCPGTAIQRGLSTYSKWIDRWPFLLPMVTLFVTLFVLQAALQWVLIVLG